MKQQFLGDDTSIADSKLNVEQSVFYVVDRGLSVIKHKSS